MLFLHWRNEETDLYDSFDTYETHYKAKEEQIQPIRLKYERNNDVLEAAIEQISTEENELILHDNDTNMHENIENTGDEYGFFDPDRPEEHTKHDLAYDMGQTCTYQTQVDYSGTKMTDSEYMQLMQSLNIKQSELCTHVLKAVDTQNDQMCIFIEGGAGVGKTQVAKAIYQSLEKFYSSQPGENPDDLHAIILAPTGMAAYHINGNTIHSGLHIDINKKDATPLSYSELNTLRSKYNKIKAVFFDEISMVGRELFKKSEKRLREIMGTTKPFGGLHVLAVGDFFQMAPVMDSYIFKDDYINYGPLAINLWTTHFYIYSLTEIMRQQGEKQFCKILNRL